MAVPVFPVIDPVATGQNIIRLRTERGLSVSDVQHWFNFDEPRAIYKWQSGETLPKVDNLYALSVLLGVTMNDILVAAVNRTPHVDSQFYTCEPAFFVCAAGPVRAIMNAASTDRRDFHARTDRRGRLPGGAPRGALRPSARRFGDAGLRFSASV